MQPAFMDAVRGKRVLFITTKNIDYIRNSQEIRILEREAGKVRKIFSDRKNYIGRVLEIWKALFKCDSSDIDVVFIGFAPQLVAPFFRKFMGKEIIIDFFISVFDTLVNDRKRIASGGIVAKLCHWLDTYVIKNADMVVTDTKADAAYFIQEFQGKEDKFQTLYLEADQSIYMPRDQQKDGNLMDKFVVLYFGSILPLQGVDIVLEAVSLLKDRDDIYIQIIGPISGKYDRPMQDNVEYIDWLPQKQLARYIANADLCLAGHFNGEIEKAKRTIPGKAYIYRSMEKTMICGDNRANRELFSEDKMVRFVPMGNANKLREAIEAVYEEQGIIQQLSERESILVSIIIPIYNVKPYLKRCIDSVLQQTYENLEVILVDDGSTDGCAEICDDYEAEDRRVRVIHKVNGGLSDARNYGMEAASGEYIFFLDSDDWIRADCIKILLTYAREKSADVAITDYMVIQEGKRKKISEKPVNRAIVFEKEEAMESLLYQRQFTTSAWGKLYKIAVIKEKRFPVGKLFEDVETVFMIIESAARVVMVDAVLYYYFKRNDSITKGKFDIKKMDYVETCKNLYHHVSEKYPHLKGAALSRLLWSEIYVIVHMDDIRQYRTEYDRLWKHIKENRYAVICDEKSSLKCRMVNVLSYMGSNLLTKTFHLIG